MVKCDGREIPCNYTELVLSRYVYINKNITVEAKLISPYIYTHKVCPKSLVIGTRKKREDTNKLTHCGPVTQICVFCVTKVKDG
jgi:hypothetical protein